MIAEHAVCVQNAGMPTDDVNVRVPKDLMVTVGHTLEMLRSNPRYDAMRLSQTAVIRLALTLGLEKLPILRPRLGAGDRQDAARPGDGRDDPKRPRRRGMSPPVGVGPLRAAITADPVTRASTGCATSYCAPASTDTSSTTRRRALYRSISTAFGGCYANGALERGRYGPSGGPAYRARRQQGASALRRRVRDQGAAGGRHPDGRHRRSRDAQDP
jgi:hypothetical protein